jgi:hypothetical protein
VTPETRFYRIAKMVGTAICAGAGYYTAHTHALPDEWRIAIESVIAAMLAVGLYVTPSPVHQSDLPMPVPPDVVEAGEPGEGAV